MSQLRAPGLLIVTVLIASGESTDARAETPTPFGPVQSRSFAWKPGTAIEQAPDKGCNHNGDFFVIRGPAVQAAKSIDVTPRVAAFERQVPIPSVNTCKQGETDCVQLYIKITGKDAPGERVVTLTHADGRTLKTTFDVVASAGRCDYPQGKQGNK